MSLGKFGFALAFAIALCTYANAAPLEAYGRLPNLDNIEISPDGRTLATGQSDGTILLWDATYRDGARGGSVSPRRRRGV